MNWEINSGKKKGKLQRKKWHLAFNILGLLSLSGTLLYVIFMWNKLPDQIPSHFNGAGIADAWSGKGMLLFPLITGIFLYGFIGVLELFPDMWNTGVKLTKENRERVLDVLKGMIVITKNCMAVCFSYMTLCSAWQRNLGKAFLPVFLCLVFVPMIWGVGRAIRVSKK